MALLGRLASADSHLTFQLRYQLPEHRPRLSTSQSLQPGKLGRQLPDRIQHRSGQREADFFRVQVQVDAILDDGITDHCDSVISEFLGVLSTMNPQP